MVNEASKTPDDLGKTTPQDLYATSDIRLVMLELGKIQNKVDGLVEDNRGHRSDFRLTLSGIIGTFLLLITMFAYGYNRLEDKFIDLNRGIAVVGTKLDDAMQRPSFPLPPSRR